MQTITIDIPDLIDLDKKEVLILIASKLYEKGKISLGQAAEMTGLSKRAFIEILGYYSIPTFNYTASELERDVKNVQNYCR